jgi:hypothetical protein
LYAKEANFSLLRRAVIDVLPAEEENWRMDAVLLRIIIAYNACRFFLLKNAAGLYAATGVSKAGVTSRQFRRDESEAAIDFMLRNRGLLIADAAIPSVSLSA